MKLLVSKPNGLDFKEGNEKYKMKFAIATTIPQQTKDSGVGWP